MTCMRPCVFISMHISRVCVCKCACVSVRVCVCARACVRACVRVTDRQAGCSKILKSVVWIDCSRLSAKANLRMHACMYVCMHVCMHACMHVCIYGMHVCVCIYACMCGNTRKEANLPRRTAHRRQAHALEVHAVGRAGAELLGNL